MRKLLVITLVGSLLFSAIPGAALAGDRHSGSNLAAGMVLGATAAVVGGVLLNAFSQPVIAAPPVAYAPPPTVYAPAPVVVYAPPPPMIYAPPPPVVYAPAPSVVYAAPPVLYAPAPVVYAPAPVVVHRHWVPRGHSERWQQKRHGGWYRR